MARSSQRFGLRLSSAALLAVLISCSSKPSVNEAAAASEKTSSPEASDQPEPSSSTDAPVTVSAVPSVEPDGNTSLEIRITNSGPQELEFDQVLTTYHGEGRLWFASVHQIQEPGKIEAVYIYKNQTPPQELREYAWKMPSGKTEFLYAVVRYKDFATAKQRRIEVSLGYRGNRRYGPIRAPLPDGS